MLKFIFVCVTFFIAIAYGRKISVTGERDEFDAPMSWNFIREKYFHDVDFSNPHTFVQGFFKNFMAHVPSSFVRALESQRQIRKEHNLKRFETFGPYFAWIPIYEVSAIPGSEATWTAPCFEKNSIQATLTENGALLQLDASKPSKLICSDWYLIATLEGLQFHTFTTPGGQAQINWKFDNITDEEMDDVRRNGFRVFRFLDSFLQTLTDLFDTAELFVPILEQPVEDKYAKMNIDFMTQYANFNMEPRNITTINIPASMIRSGDVFGIIRLDGLDPMLAWAMGGSHTGHMTMAMWMDGVLNICESTTRDGYWKIGNGVECTEYQKWLDEAETVDYNVVWLPLAEANRTLFNTTKAIEFIQENLGLNYGFGNILWAWVDTEEDNYPYPLTWQLHQLLPALLSKLSPALADLLWNQAFNFRLGTNKLTTAQIYSEMYKRGMSFGNLTSLPEQDDWLYEQKNNNNETVYGRSMVCDVFVCEVLKAGGVFGDVDFQCSEATNWDIYTLKMFDSSNRPDECLKADPNLPFCQIMGKYRLTLDYFNTRYLYPHSFNNCPRGNAPDWNKPIGC